MFIVGLFITAKNHETVQMPLSRKHVTVYGTLIRWTVTKHTTAMCTNTDDLAKQGTV